MTLKTFILPSFVSLALLCLVSASPAASYSWVRGDNSDEIHLYQDGRHVGGYRYSTKEYFSFNSDTKTWSEPVKESPWGMSPIQPVTLANNYGIDVNKRSDKERWVVDGKEVDPKSIQGPDSVIPDDGNLPWLVWVGDPVVGEKIRQDFQTNPSLTPWKNSFRFQSYTSQDVMIHDRDGKDCYLPGLTAVKADRHVMWNLKAYTTPETLAGYLRKLDPNVKPSDTPDLPTISEDPNILPELPLSVSTGGLSLLSGLGALFLLSSSKKKS